MLECCASPTLRLPAYSHTRSGRIGFGTPGLDGTIHHDENPPIASLKPSAIALATLLVASPSWAGPSLDEALARHRALLATGDAGSGLSPISLAAEPPTNDVTLAVGGPGSVIPPLLAPEERGNGGLQVRSHTAWFGGAVDARLGAAWWAGDAIPGRSTAAPSASPRAQAASTRRSSAGTGARPGPAA